MDIWHRRRIIVKGETLGNSLKEIGSIIVERKLKGLPNEEIARRLNYDFGYPIRQMLNKMELSPEELKAWILERLNECFSKPLHNGDGKFARALQKQIPSNDFFERELAFLDNLIIKDFSKYLKDNNLKTKLIGSGDGKMKLALHASEKIQIANFLSAWAAQFGAPVSMPFWYEDLNMRKPRLPDPDKFNPNVKKEKITSMFL